MKPYLASVDRIGLFGAIHCPVALAAGMVRIGIVQIEGPAVRVRPIDAVGALIPLLKRNAVTTAVPQGFLAFLKRNIGGVCSVLKSGKVPVAVGLFRCSVSETPSTAR